MSYLRNRLIQAIVTLYGVITFGFVAIQMMPGGPRSALRAQIRDNPTAFGLPPNPTMEQINDVLNEQLQNPPDQSIWEAYISYMWSVTQGDFGTSLIVEPGASNLHLILEAAPWTIFISSVALVYGLLMGLILGTAMAYYEGSKFDVAATISTLVVGAVPFYVVGIIILYFASYQLGWFPTGGRYDSSLEPGFNPAFVSSVFYHSALPVFTLLFVNFGVNALGMRANSVRLLGADYIRVAELRGLSTYKITTRYLGRNAILPMYTGIVIGIAGLIGGTVILEVIFTYPGMGMLMFDATVMRDFPLLTANLILVTFLFILGTLLADFTYALIDPRAEQSSMG